MKTKALLLLTIIMLSACKEQNVQQEETMDTKTIETTATQKKQALLRHVVLFKFKDTATKAQIENVENAFAALPSKITTIQDFEWGLNNSPENLDKGFTHCFFVSFASEEDRAIYLPHPDHLAFVAVLKPHLEDVLVLDYWTGQL